MPGPRPRASAHSSYKDDPVWSSPWCRPDRGRPVRPVRERSRCLVPTDRQAGAAPAAQAVAKNLEMDGRNGSLVRPADHWHSTSGGALAVFFRYIFYGQQNEGTVRLEPNPPSVQHHVSRANDGKIMAHFEIVHPGIARNDFLQQLAQLWNIPLAVAQLVNQTAFGFSG